jgi:hypothetical protein
MFDAMVNRVRSISWYEKASIKADLDIWVSSPSYFMPGGGLIIAMFRIKKRTSLIIPWSRGVRLPMDKAMDGRATRTAVLRIGAASKLMMARL